MTEDDRRYLRAHPDLTVPPPELRYNAIGACTIEHFLRSGSRAAEDIEAALKSVDRSWGDIRAFLDFGCGCGRLMLALRNRGPGPELVGCDVDGQAIDWCTQHLEHARFVANEPLPPLPFESSTFDVAWCGSVFTHLDEDRQDRWLTELRRILTPGGILLASVHGPACWEPRLPSRAGAELAKKGMLFVRFGIDAGIHPDWYQVAYHTEEYIRTHWASTFEIRGYLPRGFSDMQDIVIAQRS